MPDNYIFNVFDISDIPENLKKEIRINGRSGKLKTMVIALFELSDGTLTLDQLVLGMYRKFGHIVQRSRLSVLLYQLSNGNCKRVERVTRGVYKIVSH